MLLTIAVWDTPENKRTPMTRETLVSFNNTVDWSRHRLVISDNGSCDDTQEVYQSLRSVFPFTLIQNGKNIGTAAAVNKGWELRKPGEHALKADNDVVIRQRGWADEIEEVFSREPRIGICGLKRKDLEERPNHKEEHYRSSLCMLPHIAGQKWIIVEECLHIMGTCQGYSSALLDKIGYLYQGQDEGKLYGLDDSLASFRARLAGFSVVFLPHIEIDHIDPGGNTYSDWKQSVAADSLGFTGKENWLDRMKNEYLSGKRPLYWKD